MQKSQYLVHLNFAKGYRGGERQTQLLIEALSQRGYVQTIVTREASQLAERLQGVKNLNIIRCSKPYVLDIHKIKNATLIHAHETKAAQVAYFAHLIYKIPYFITRRVNNPISDNFFNKNIYTKATCTVVLSKAIQHTTLKLHKNITTQIIPSAYTKLELNQEKINTIKERFKDKFLIGHIGELENSDKGQYYLIEAMKKLQSEYPEIHLILIGKGKDEGKFREQSKELENITFEGFVNNVGDYISALQLFVFPSLNEGLGSILLDIIQAKVPIIASNVGGIPDIVQHNKNGLLFPPKNTQAIYDKIIQLYNNQKLRQKFSAEAFKDINNYSYQTMTTKYEELYRSINK
ncbi:MAG: Glycosyltransferase [uncultured Sulfurovum sp.]|uniref:Glycosyltransferase n=1 Tax=uncultured Sulfurovum sp. TaxID=269237 RepID=A0A6S6TVL1_9BACT|nr:MAG: Glycosyltransferase [uncultured Sulfurovum sp.]